MVTVRRIFGLLISALIIRVKFTTRAVVAVEEAEQEEEEYI